MTSRGGESNGVRDQLDRMPQGDVHMRPRYRVQPAEPAFVGDLVHSQRGHSELGQGAVHKGPALRRGQLLQVDRRGIGGILAGMTMSTP